jgi:hypothetical protein
LEKSEFYEAVFLSMNGSNPSSLALISIPGLHFNRQLPDGTTPLTKCAEMSESPDLMKALLADPNVLVNLADGSGETALSAVCCNLVMFQLLLACPSVDADAAAPGSKMTVLIKLVSSRDQAAFEALQLQLAVLGLDFNLQDRNGNTAMMSAVKRRNGKAFQELVRMERCDLTMVNNAGIGVVELALEDDKSGVKPSNLQFDRRGIIALIQSRIGVYKLTATETNCGQWISKSPLKPWGST